MIAQDQEKGIAAAAVPVATPTRAMLAFWDRWSLDLKFI